VLAVYLQKFSTIELVFRALALTLSHSFQPTWTLSSYSELKTTPSTIKFGLQKIRKKIVTSFFELLSKLSWTQLVNKMRFNFCDFSPYLSDRIAYVFLTNNLKIFTFSLNTLKFRGSNSTESELLQDRSIFLCYLKSERPAVLLWNIFIEISYAILVVLMFWKFLMRNILCLVYMHIVKTLKKLSI